MFLVALTFFSIEWMVKLKLTSLSGYRNYWGYFGIDVDALIVTNETQDVKQPVGDGEYPKSIPIGVYEVLSEMYFTICSKRRPVVAIPMIAGKSAYLNLFFPSA